MLYLYGPCQRVDTELSVQRKVLVLGTICRDMDAKTGVHFSFSPRETGGIPRDRSAGSRLRLLPLLSDQRRNLA